MIIPCLLPIVSGPRLEMDSPALILHPQCQCQELGVATWSRGGLAPFSES